MLNKFISMVVLFFVMSGVAQLANAKSTFADLVLINGYIYTVDAKKTVAQSIAIKNKKIIFVGSDQEANSYVGKRTQIIDLKGKFVLPGFIDTHMHPFWMGWYSQNLTIGDPYTVKGTIDNIREYVKDNPMKSVIEGYGYSRQTFIGETGEAPTKEILDAIDSTRPIMIVDHNGHSCWVNSKALELIGFNENTPDPQNGTVVRIPGTKGFGEPNGQLLEEAYFMAVAAFPAPTEAQSREAINYFQNYLASFGLTTVHDMLVDVSDQRQIVMYKEANEMAKNDQLNMRILGSWYLNPNRNDLDQQIANYDAISKTFNSDNFQVKAYKFLIDGIVEESTGLLLSPYCSSVELDHTKCNSDKGFDIWGLAKRDLTQYFAKVTSLGYQINAHVIGDGATRKVLDALEAAKISSSMRPSLEHIQLADPIDIVRMGKLGVSANVTPLWMGLDSYFSIEYYPRLGFDRAYNGTYPYQSLFDAGVNVTTSSDWGVSEPNMGQQIYMALTRLYPRSLYNTFFCCEKGYENTYPYIEDLSHILNPSDFDPVNKAVMPIASLPPFRERSASIERVLEAVTINGAKANFLENETGSLEVGKYADLVVLDTNYIEVAKTFTKSGLASDLEPIANSKVLKTIFKGRIVYDGQTVPASFKRIHGHSHRH